MRILMRLSFFTSYVASSFLVFNLLMAFDATAVRYNAKGEPLAEDSDGKENGSRHLSRPNASFRNQQQSVLDQSGSGAAAAAAETPLLQVRNDQDDEKAPAAPLVNFSKEWAALRHSPFKKLPTTLFESILLQYLPHTTGLSLVCQKFRSAFKSERHWRAFISDSALTPRYDALRVLNPGLTAFRFCSIACPNEWNAQKAFLEYQLKRNQQNGKAISQLVRIREGQSSQRLEAEFLLQKFKVLLEGGWDVLMLAEHNGVSPEVLAQARLYRARLLCWGQTKNVDPHLIDRLTQVSQNNKLPQGMRDLANYYRGVLRVWDQTDVNEAFKLLTDASENENLPPSIRSESNFFRGMMLFKREGAANGREAFRLFTDASENDDIPQFIRDMANLFRGALCAENRTEAIDDGKALRLLTTASENEGFPQELRDMADYWKGLMLTENRTEAIDDEEAFRLLTDVSRNERLPQWMRNQANWFRVVFHLQYLAGTLDNEEAFKILTNTSINKAFSIWIRAEANYYRGMMRARHRTKAIDDGEAFGLLTDASANRLLFLKMRDEASYYRAVMRAEHRTGMIHDLETFRYLTDASRNENLAQSIRDEANFFRGMMRAQNRTDAIDDAEAVRLFTDVSENEDLPQDMRDTANYYREMMRAQNRTAEIDDEETAASKNNETNGE